MERNLIQDKERNFYGKQYQNLVYKIAHDFNVPDIVREELYGEGFLGLTKAINTFDKDYEDSTFLSYAYTCIYNQMAQFMRKENRRKKYEIPKDEVYMLNTDNADNYAPFESLADTIPNGEMDILDFIVLKEELQEVFDFLETIKPNKREVFRLRMGIGERYPLTQLEVAQKLGITQAYVCKIEKYCIRKVNEYRIQKEERERVA